MYSGIIYICLGCLVRVILAQTDCTCVSIYECPTTIDLPQNAPLPEWAKTGNCSDGEVCCDTEDILPDDNVTCGIHFNVGFRIFNQPDITAVFEFPWMAAVQETKVLDGIPVRIYRGGGSLIHPQVVITSGHKVHKVNPSNLTVRVGDWDTHIDGEPFPHEDRDVREIIFHEDFNRTYHIHNIALLVLKEPFPLRENINIVCLPKPDEVIVRNDCVAAGWGQNSSENGEFHKVLRKVDLPIVPREECISRLKKSDQLPSDFQLHESMICAGGVEGKDTCKGDGGSPLMCPLEENNKALQLVGMVSWGIGCGNDIPGAYVNIPFHRAWIDQQMEKLGFTTQYDYQPS